MQPNVDAAGTVRRVVLEVEPEGFVADGGRAAARLMK
jgi:hypothetical protein